MRAYRGGVSRHSGRCWGRVRTLRRHVLMIYGDRDPIQRSTKLAEPRPVVSGWGRGELRSRGRSGQLIIGWAEPWGR